MKKTWFITGSSRGLGRSLMQAVLASGDNVVATARNTEDLKELTAKYGEQILPIQLDVNVKEEITAAVENAITHFGRIDVLVNNAGFGITGATEAYTEEQVNSQLMTNLYAPIALSRAVLPHMRKQRSGRILQISSIGGRRGSVGVSIYQAAKFGLGGFTEALNNEVNPLGIFVTSVEPGGFRTDWGSSSMTFAPKVEGYEETTDKRAELFAEGKFQPAGDPDKAAKVMIQLATHPKPPVHLVLGSDAVKMIRQADTERTAELEAWLQVSESTDSDDAADFTATEQGQFFMKKK
ncbi:SDR family NAD(P)-dependent oxidoreductase [Mucilaginibacter limnophilus]|uniref:SDR family NAD(P)-dependent oxidoreductase n=1 Tax=Mucilaginibacter limnophilus TaxID=1932778 RepID=A0A3S2VK85_9SPHI|nr:SDR family NAD(P)-dependent oxidoreductase [Mucilaginibacter limnophilus]RVT97331.1 SDR family NAD(P)-dependent oxidoreductase [Mucilaginibacter limnophilus]